MSGESLTLRRTIGDLNNYDFPARMHRRREVVVGIYTSLLEKEYTAMVDKTIACLLALSVICAPSIAQTETQSAANGPTKAFVLQEGTPVELRLTRNVSSADAQVGESIDFEVLEEVKVNDVLVISKGGLTIGTVTEAQPKRRMARGGKLDMNIDYVRLVDGEKAALRAVKEVKGGGHTGAMTAGIVATGLLFWPAAPFFLFMHGKDITVPKGAEITGYVNGNMPMDSAKFQTVASPQTGDSTAANTMPGKTELEITSQPVGAEIEIDGDFVGNTPSTMNASSGQHQIMLKKAGFKPWERKMTVSGGHVKIDATLEAGANEGPVNSVTLSQSPSGSIYLTAISKNSLLFRMGS